MLNKLRSFLVRNYIPFQNAGIARKYGMQPVSLDIWGKKRIQLRKFIQKDNVLIASKRVLKSKGERLPVKELQEVFSGTILGDWALDEGSIILLWQKLKEQKPKIIIESGSGSSTLIFARYMQLYCPEGKVISLEQSKEEAEHTTEKLKSFGLSPVAHVLYAPLDKEEHYQVNHQEMISMLGDHKADWLVIDGPVGKDGCRRFVMDDMMIYMKKDSDWYADDSFRDGELDFLNEWQGRKDISVSGIYPVGKGLATGKIK